MAPIATNGSASVQFVNGVKKRVPPKPVLITPVYGHSKSHGHDADSDVESDAEAYSDAHSEFHGEAHSKPHSKAHSESHHKSHGKAHSKPHSKPNGIPHGKAQEPAAPSKPLLAHNGSASVQLVNGVKKRLPPKPVRITPVYGQVKPHHGEANGAPNGVANGVVHEPPPPPPKPLLAHNGSASVQLVNGVKKRLPPKPVRITPVYGQVRPHHSEANGVLKSIVHEPIVHEPPAPRAPLRTVSPHFVLEDRPIDQYPSLKAVVVGAGLAGITTAILLQAKVPGVELVILEKSAEVGGIWNTNLYPGARSDELVDVYQSTFAPKTTWSGDHPPGPEIKEYWRTVAERFRIEHCIQFNHEVLEARWCHEKSKWLIRARSNGITRTEDADFLITATGIFRDPRLPRYHGIDNFLGTVRHTSDWDPSIDLAGKRVALIGNDISGLQLLPHLRKIARHLDHYQTSPNVIPNQADHEADEWRYSPQDPRGYTRFRKSQESKTYAKFSTLFDGTHANKHAKEHFEHLVKSNTGARPDIAHHVHVDVSRTSSSSAKYLHALTQPNVSYITSPIARITRRGIETRDGHYREVDAILFATAATSSSYSTAFPIYGPTDLNPSEGDDSHKAVSNLQKKWQPPGFPDTYLGLAAPEYPNLFFLFGANSTPAGSTSSYAAESQATYIAKVLRKARTQGILTITPSAEATKDFRAYCESFFPTTALSKHHTAAGYNGGVPGGRVLAFWPGSAVHASIARRDPRWEDFTYTYRNGQGNRFAYLGNGWSVKDTIAASLGDRAAEKLGFAGYLREDSVGWGGDLRSLHEEWWEN